MADDTAASLRAIAIALRDGIAELRQLVGGDQVCPVCGRGPGRLRIYPNNDTGQVAPTPETPSIAFIDPKRFGVAYSSRIFWTSTSG